MVAQMMIFAKLFVLGVSLGVALSDQSAAALQEDETDAGVQEKGRIDTPAVVLQLKYAKGELNRIYLAQFRKGNTEWRPSVAVRSDLCSDLCHAGLGGEACGPTCEDLMPVGLQSALANSSDDRPSQDTRMTAAEMYGEPRVDVCPALCGNKLGQPLCNCAETLDKMADVNWGAVCTSFCGDNYVLRGCPTCEGAPSQIAKFSSRTLSTAEGWALWCNAQCRQGHGGAACNCDRSPL